MSHGETAPARRTDSNPWFANERLAKQETITWKARDGLELQGVLIHPLDVGGVAVLISAGRRVASVWKPAALGAVLGILARMAGHALL